MKDLWLNGNRFKYGEKTERLLKFRLPFIVSASTSTKRQLILDEVTHLVSGKRFIKLNYITIQWTRVLENNEGREF